MNRYSQQIDLKHLDVLDGLRVLLSFIVAWFHIWQQSWLIPVFSVGGRWFSLDFLPRSGYSAVDGLLFLSGLLLYLPCVEGPAPRPWAFYKKRLIRIVPPYLLAVAVSFAYVLTTGVYGTTWNALRDLLAHLTFTHNLFPFSYTLTPMNGVLWTLGIEMEFYLLFPLVCRAYKKRPLLTGGAMFLIAFAYRAYVAGFEDTSFYINQLPAFLDTYCFGFLAAETIVALHKRFREESGREKLFFTCLALLCVYLYAKLMEGQAAENGLDNIRLGQMERRFSIGLLLMLFSVSACYSLPALRFLLGNRVMRFLSVVSYEYYIWHQFLAVQLKRLRVVPSASLSPWTEGEQPWQWIYQTVCFLLPLALAVALTWGVDRPIARLLGRGGKKAKADPA